LDSVFRAFDLEIDDINSQSDDERGLPALTLSRGFGVLRIRTAHCMSVVGGFSIGTTGSLSF
jgi:hypothetical protein